MAVSDPQATDIDAISAEVEAWLRNRLPAEWVKAIDEDDAEALAAARLNLDEEKWFIDLADAGYVTPGWPTEYGGLAAPGKVGSAIARTLGRYKVPRFTNPVGVDLVGPALLRWGTEEQREKFLRPIARHTEIWCQLFSEPGAGSDLASLATRAVRDGDEWVVNGQKVWASLAHISAYGMLLARTNPDVPKHEGITVFLVPMDAPGVTIRPLPQITGDAEFNEVFLDDVRIPDSMRIGPVDEGWAVTLSVLLNERQSIAGSGASLPGTVTGRSIGGLIKRHAPIADPALRDRFTELYIEDKLVSLTNQRASARRKAGQPPGPEASITKLFFSEHTQRLHSLALDLEGPAGQAWVEGDRWHQNTAWAYLRVRSKTIAGGTSEVQRNILGERVLGLPKEPSADRGVPWSQVKRS
jgi:alkylation response protein AidB-like acyl-CoA dehydrogenase